VPAAEEECTTDPFAMADIRKQAAERIEKKRGTMGRAKKQMVVSSHRFATEAGRSILRAGGSAADAFIAATLVEDVVFPGVTSTAGLAGIAVFDAKTKKVTILHGGLGDPIDPAKRWKRGDTAKGKEVLIPGAPAAYVELSKRFGKKKLSELVERAATHAEGYVLDKLFARSIAGSVKRLSGSPAFVKTYMKNGAPLAEGERLERPEMARTLRAFGKDPSFFYKGAWPAKAVAAANAAGGTLDVKDFSTYQGVEVTDAVHAHVGENDLYAGGYGGVMLLMELMTLDRLRTRAESPAKSQEALERLVRVFRAVNQQPVLYDRDVGTDTALWSDRIAKLMIDSNGPKKAPPAGTHSSAVAVVDAEGNVVVGTHTIEALNWGEGFIIDGIPLPTAASIGMDDATIQKKRMRIDPLTDTIVLHDGAPVAALAVFGSGLAPADVQVLDGVLARGLDAEEAVLEPRVGFYSFDIDTNKTDMTTNSVDPRFEPRMLCLAAKHGVKLTPSMPGMPAGYVDTGFPTLVVWRDGEIHGMPPDPAHIDGLAAGD